MKSLQEIYNELQKTVQSDKGTKHSYITFYEKLFKKKRGNGKNSIKFLEIGVRTGASIILWGHYFGKNSSIYGIDHKLKMKEPLLLENTQLKIAKAYDEGIFEFLRTYGPFDIILDDGSHAEKDMVFVVKHYIPYLAKDGIMIIEDIPDYKFNKSLYSQLSKEDKENSYIVDRRYIRPRGDDLLFIIDRS